MKQRTLSRVKDQTSKLASGISGVSLVRLPSAKLLSLFFGIMTCAERPPPLASTLLWNLGCLRNIQILVGPVDKAQNSEKVE
jgi:hypothetical protein